MQAFLHLREHSAASTAMMSIVQFNWSQFYRVRKPNNQRCGLQLFLALVMSLMTSASAFTFIRRNQECHLIRRLPVCKTFPVCQDSISGFRGMTAEEATRDVIEKQLSEVRRLNELGELHVENIDVFCEKGVFNVDQTRRILQAGKQAGLKINFHGEELSCLGSAEVKKNSISLMKWMLHNSIIGWRRWLVRKKIEKSDFSICGQQLLMIWFREPQRKSKPELTKKSDSSQSFFFGAFSSVLRLLARLRDKGRSLISFSTWHC